MEVRQVVDVLGPVSLTVRDLSSSLQYYNTAIGLEIIRQEPGLVHLGAGGRDLLILQENSLATRAGRTTGLYHIAFLLPSRRDLARQLQHLIESRVAIAGMSDHLVSEAVYLYDPEGNGIEIYHDRPRADWAWIDGEIEMTTTPMDEDGVMSTLNHGITSWSGIPADTIVGHVHLKVADLLTAEAFYRDILGFETTTTSYPGACFLSKGRYHHHIGLNIWRSGGAPALPESSPGLKYWSYCVSTSVEYDQIHQRALEAGLLIGNEAGAFTIRDPSGNAVRLVATY